MHLSVIDLYSYHESVTAALNAVSTGYNPLEMDRQAAKLLRLDWQQIPHLSEAFRFELLQGSLQTAAK
jgi:hypothetical protein